MQQEYPTPRQDRDTIWQERWATALLVSALLWLVDDVCLYLFIYFMGPWVIITPVGWFAPVAILATLISTIGFAATDTDPPLSGHSRRGERRRGHRVVFALVLSLLAFACFIGLFYFSSPVCQQHPQACE